MDVTKATRHLASAAIIVALFGGAVRSAAADVPAASRRPDEVSAVRLLALIERSSTRSAAWYWLARYEAQAGLYSDAEASAAKVVPNSAGISQKDLEDTRKFIAECSVTKRKDAPMRLDRSYLTRLRRGATVFTAKTISSVLSVSTW
jgi:hypothetical protein